MRRELGGRAARDGGKGAEELSWPVAGGSGGGWGCSGRKFTKEMSPLQQAASIPEWLSPLMGSCMGKGIRNNNNLQINLRYLY